MMVLIWIFLMSNEGEQLFMCLFANYIFFGKVLKSSDSF